MNSFNHTYVCVRILQFPYHLYVRITLYRNKSYYISTLLRISNVYVQFIFPESPGLDKLRASEFSRHARHIPVTTIPAVRCGVISSWRGVVSIYKGRSAVGSQPLACRTCRLSPRPPNWSLVSCRSWVFLLTIQDFILHSSWERHRPDNINIVMSNADSLLHSLVNSQEL